jgi:hypothetical protein
MVAFQANTSNLWTFGVGTSGYGDTRLGMMLGTSPSITSMPSGGYMVAFQANTSNLWTFGVGTSGYGNTGLSMKSGTSPSIAALSGGNYVTSVQSSNSALRFFSNAATLPVPDLCSLPGKCSPACTPGIQQCFRILQTQTCGCVNNPG